MLRRERFTLLLSGDGDLDLDPSLQANTRLKY